MRRLVALAASLAALAGATSAHGQSIFVVVSNGAPAISSIATQVRISGTVTLDFHGDPAAGCAAAGLCGVSGTVVWDPSGPGQVFSYAYRRRGQRFEGALLSFGQDAFGNAQPTTSARVRRGEGGGAPGPSSLCADGAGQDFQLVSLGERPGSSVEIGLIARAGADFAGPDNFRTRCAGPVSDDVRSLLPRRVVSERALRRGGGVLHFSADRAFSAGGFTGTLHSNVVMHLGRTQDLLEAQRSDEPFRTHPVRRRAIDVRYRVERVSGQVVTGVRGLADPDLCGPLDACGLMGTVTTTTRASSGVAGVSALAGLRHSRGELRRAVGLAPGGAPSGVRAFGSAYWEHDAGTIVSALTRDGAGGCSDAQPVDGAGGLTLAFSRNVVHASYGSSDSFPSDLLRTRCPGPPGAEAAGTGALATGTVPLSAFRRRRVTLRLTTGRSYRADGYRGSTSPDVTIVLRRTGIRQHVEVFQEPDLLQKLLARRIP